MILRAMHQRIKAIPDSAKSSIALVISSLLVKGITFIVTPLFTRIMNIDDYGLVTTYNSWVSIIEIFAVLGLTSAGVFNVGMKDNKKTRSEYIASCLGLCNLTTLITFIGVFIIKGVLGDKSMMSYEMLCVMFIHFFFSPAQIFWLTRQKYEYKYKLSTAVSIISVLISQFLSVLLVVLMRNKSFGKVLGYEMGVVLFAIPIYVALIKRGKEYINIKRWEQILLLSLPLIPHYLAQHIMASSDKIMLSSMASTADSAIYGVVMNIGLIGAIFWNSINASLVPYSFDKIDTHKEKDIDRVSKTLLLSYASLLLLVILLSPEVLSLLAPDNYNGGIYCVPPLAFSVFLQAIYNLFANIEFYNKKTKGIAIATVLAALINIALNLALIPQYGYTGASYATMIANIALIVFHYIAYKRTNTNNVYDAKFIAIVSICLLAISLICIPLYQLIYPRYVIIVAAIIIFWLYRGRIKKTIKQIKA